jgi:hypothetical protein
VRYETGSGRHPEGLTTRQEGKAMGTIKLNLVDELGCLLVLAKFFELGTGRVPKW